MLVVLTAGMPGEALAAGVPSLTAVTFLAIGLLLVAAKAAGLVERIGQPAVLGELLIGVAIGNLYLLGMPGLDPLVQQHLIGNEILRFLAELGVVILLFQIGLESEIATMRKVGIPALRRGDDRRRRAVRARHLGDRSAAAARTDVQRPPVRRRDADRDLGRASPAACSRT